MEKLVKALLLFNRLLPEEDISYAGEFAWSTVLRVLEDLGHDLDEETRMLVDERTRDAQESTDFLVGCINYSLKNRSLWRRLFGPPELSSRDIRVIREHMEETLGVY